MFGFKKTRKEPEPTIANRELLDCAITSYNALEETSAELARATATIRGYERTFTTYITCIPTPRNLYSGKTQGRDS